MELDLTWLAASDQTQGAGAHHVPPRASLDRAHTWNTESIFASHAEWAQALAAVESELPRLDAFRGHLGDSPVSLADWLQLSEDLGQRLGKVMLYASMLHNVDTADQAAAAMQDRARGLLARGLAAAAFAQPEMLSIGLDRLRSWTQTEPRLAIYEHYFDTLERRQAHVRSAEVEELLASVRDPFSSAASLHGTLADADLKFPPALGRAEPSDGSSETPLSIPVSQGNIHSLLGHPDREVRRTAWEGYSDAHLTLKNTMAGCIATGVKQRVWMSRARRYSSAMQAALAQNHIPVVVLTQLIETYRKHLPIWHRYWAVRRRALGYDKLHVYDLRAPLTKAPPVIPFQQAVDWIAEGMQPMGEEYVRVMRRGLEQERWVDIYPNQGKRAGAFSTGVPGTYPFIMMSYNDGFFGLSTLAHELGHSMHSYYAWRTQPYVYSGYSIFVAEVASNFNQALVRAHLLASNPDPEFQIALIEEAMANFQRYFFIMPALARFELEIHSRVERNQALTADELIELMASLFQEGYGGEVEFDLPRIGITWAEFATHLYSNFYVYQYATGISGAHALAAGVLAGRPGAAENYLAFLRAGSSLYPLDALALAGVDLTSTEPVETTFAVLSSMVDRLDELVSRRADRPTASALPSSASHSSTHSDSSG